ncbi:MAG TPA: hypothetical protein VEA99_15900 [Gemmatimonadaceae bacterium]|nr:hypothetical protein [Gemmatimonadaceae bacterium]
MRIIDEELWRVAYCNVVERLPAGESFDQRLEAYERVMQLLNEPAHPIHEILAAIEEDMGAADAREQVIRWLAEGEWPELDMSPAEALASVGASSVLARIDAERHTLPWIGQRPVH